MTSLKKVSLGRFSFELVELELKRAGKVPSFSLIAYSVISSSLVGRVSEDLDP